MQNSPTDHADETCPRVEPEASCQPQRDVENSKRRGTVPEEKGTTGNNEPMHGDAKSEGPHPEE